VLEALRCLNTHAVWVATSHRSHWNLRRKNTLEKQKTATKPEAQERQEAGPASETRNTEACWGYLSSQPSFGNW
jgi:hypothetical protein